MKSPLIISVSGLARSGKDSFCKILSSLLAEKGIKTANLSFASQLREDSETFLNKLGFDVWSDEDKDQFRPFLVWQAGIRRKKSGGQYYIESLKNWMDELLDHKVFTISDLRFKEYENDELDFCKQYGPVVHITKYKKDSQGSKVYTEPPNETERENDPKIKAGADYILEWEDQDGKTADLIPEVQKFVTWLEDHGFLS